MKQLRIPAPLREIVLPAPNAPGIEQVRTPRVTHRACAAAGSNASRPGAGTHTSAMNDHQTPSADLAPVSLGSRLARALPAASVLAGAALATLAGCGGGGGAQSVSSGTAGAVSLHPEPQRGSRSLLVDANQSGQASSLRMTQVAWGRLAKVRDSVGQLQQSEMVIGEDIATDNVDYRLDTNPITEETTVTILHPYTPSAIVNGIETSPFQRALQRLDRNLTPITDRDITIDELGPFSLVPRNAAIVLQFNDLLDETTVDRANVKLVTGTPPSAPFETRILVDINHGAILDRDGNGVGEFYPTRLIVDTTVSPIESATATTPLPVNALGLPASTNASQANVGLRIPTRVDNDGGQFTLLRSLSGRALAFNGNGNTDATSSTEDVVRGARSGGATTITGDVNNGFLVDQIPPRLVGTQAAAITTPVPDGLGNFTTVMRYQVTACQAPVKGGDVLEQPGAFAEIVQAANDGDDGTVDGFFTLRFRVIFPLNGSLTAGAAQITSLFDPVVNVGQAACFVRFPSITTPPDVGVATDSSIVIRFSEPMDPGRVNPFDTFTVTRIPAAPTAKDFVIGSVVPSSDLKEFRFTPSLPFKHTLGNTEQFFINLLSGADGPIDLAGNPIGAALPQVPFRVNASDPTRNNGGVALRFSSTDEISDNNGAGRLEWRGQFLFDVIRGVIKPRAVVHYTAVADRSQPVPSLMAAFPQGVQTPLSPLGSKLQTLWRYCDLGLGLLDETNFNVDVEGLAWAPIGGNAVADQYTLFEQYLSTTKRLPDESVDAFLMPLFPSSGLVNSFALNPLDPVNDPVLKVHDRSRGYVVNPADMFTATSGTRMMPWPFNRGLPIAQQKTYTWRDTSIQTKGAPPDSPGAQLQVVINATGIGGTPGTPYPPNQVPTIGLPLLMEFRCFPDSEALGINAFDISIAALNSAQPNFRAFSTGGVQGANTIIRNPDTQTIALGGFNPASVPPGAGTPGVDNTFYLGQANLVTRVSRAHSLWFDAGASTTQYITPVIEPRAENQPAGTSVQLHFRGATAVTGGTGGVNVLSDADLCDPYGDARPPATVGGTVTFLGGTTPGPWRTTIDQVSGARFFQVRITFIANLETALAPEVSALGFAYRL